MSGVSEILVSKAGTFSTFPVENRAKLSTAVEDTPTICGVCNFLATPYIVVKRSKEHVSSEHHRERAKQHTKHYFCGP